MEVLETKLGILFTFIQLREKLNELLIENNLLEKKSNKNHMKLLQRKKQSLNDEYGLNRMTVTQLGNPPYYKHLKNRSCLNKIDNQ